MVKGDTWWRGDSWLPISPSSLESPLHPGYALLEVAEKMTGQARYVESAKDLKLYPLTLQLVAELVYVIHDCSWAAQKATVILPYLSDTMDNIVAFVPFSALRFVSSVQEKVSSLDKRGIDGNIYSTVDARKKTNLPRSALKWLADLESRRGRGNKQRSIA